MISNEEKTRERKKHDTPSFECICSILSCRRHWARTQRALWYFFLLFFIFKKNILNFRMDRHTGINAFCVRLHSLARSSHLAISLWIVHFHYGSEFYCVFENGWWPRNCYRPLIIIITTSELIFQMNTPAYIEFFFSEEKARATTTTNEELYNNKREEKWTFFQEW